MDFISNENILLFHKKVSHMQNSIFKSTKSLLIVSMIFLASCKKNYTCECTQIVTVPAFSNNGQIIQQQITTSSFTNTFKSKKDEASSTCKKGESIKSYPSTYSTQGQGNTVETISCALK